MKTYFEIGKIIKYFCFLTVLISTLTPTILYFNSIRKRRNIPTLASRYKIPDKKKPYSFKVHSYSKLITNISDETKILKYYLNYNKKEYLHLNRFYKLNVKTNKKTFRSKIIYSNKTIVKELNNLTYIKSILIRRPYDYFSILKAHNLVIPNFDNIYKLNKDVRSNQTKSINHSYYSLKNNNTNFRTISYNSEEETIGANSVYKLMKLPSTLFVRKIVSGREKIIYYSQKNNGIRQLSISSNNHLLNNYSSENTSNLIYENSFIRKLKKINNENLLLQEYSNLNASVKKSKRTTARATKNKSRKRIPNFQQILTEVGIPVTVIISISTGLFFYEVYNVKSIRTLESVQNDDYKEVATSTNTELHDFISQGTVVGQTEEASDLAISMSEIFHERSTYNMIVQSGDLSHFTYNLKVRSDIYHDILPTASSIKSATMLSRRNITIVNKEDFIDRTFTLSDSIGNRFKTNDLTDVRNSVDVKNPRLGKSLDNPLLAKSRKVSDTRNISPEMERKSTRRLMGGQIASKNDYKSLLSLNFSTDAELYLSVKETAREANFHVVLKYFLSLVEFEQEEQKNIIPNYQILASIYDEIRGNSISHSYGIIPKIPLTEDTWRIFFFQSPSLYTDYCNYMDHIYTDLQSKINAGISRIHVPEGSTISDEDTYYILRRIFDGQIFSPDFIREASQTDSRISMLSPRLFDLAFMSPERENVIIDIINHMQSHILESKDNIYKVFDAYSKGFENDTAKGIVAARIKNVNVMNNHYKELFLQMQSISAKANESYKNADLVKPTAFNHLDEFLGNKLFHPDFVYDQNIIHIMNNLDALTDINTNSKLISSILSSISII